MNRRPIIQSGNSEKFYISQDDLKQLACGTLLGVITYNAEFTVLKKVLEIFIEEDLD